MRDINNIDRVKKILKAQKGLQLFTPNNIKPITRWDYLRLNLLTLSTLPLPKFNATLLSLTYWNLLANNGLGEIDFTDPSKEYFNLLLSLPEIELPVLNNVGEVEPTDLQAVLDILEKQLLKILEKLLRMQNLRSIASGVTLAGMVTGNQTIADIGLIGGTALSVADLVKSLKGLTGVNKTAGVGGIAGTVADTAKNVLFKGVHDLDSGLTSGLNNAYDTVSSSLMAFTPVGTIVGGAMKVGGFVGDALSSMGVGTDQMTTTDLVLDSNFLKLTPVGLINAIGAKKTQDFSANKQTIELVGGSYGGSVKNINDAVSKAGKKYGLFSGGARDKANNLINTARGQQNTMTGIAGEASDRLSIASNMSQLNHLNYGFNLNGGYDLRYMRAAHDGGKLTRIKKLNLSKFKTGGTITCAVNLETKEIEWVPIITDPIEVYKDGGKIWTPTITDYVELLLDGGTIKPKFEDWFKSLKFKDSNYDYKKAYELFDTELLLNHAKDPENNHLFSVSPKADIDGRFPFLKLGKVKDNPEILGEFDWYNSEEGKEQQSKYDIIYDNDRYYYTPKKFEEGGKTKELDEIEETNLKNVIPEGALHARKHHMENSDGLTEKGIPVIDNDREQLAEIELNEIIFTLEVTKKLEELLKDGSDNAAIEAGKLLVLLILFNTDDRTGLISTLKLGGQLKNKE